MNKLLAFSIVVFSFLAVKAQKDTLISLRYNQKLMHLTSIKENLEPYKSNPTSKKALILPFLDDFSQQHFYPDASKWINNNVYINSTSAVNPPSYGVATFDGLDSTGYPYNFLVPTAHGIADYLTSKTIDLSIIIDSVFLSFYYQPQGVGTIFEMPQPNDSLKLEFFRKSDSTWVRKWAVPGTALAPFKKAMIPVDTSFQNDAFQFRFLNYATLSGNVDRWNLDYVYLNDNRNHADTTLFDVALTGDFYNMLNEFTAMPYTHYKQDSIGNMATAIDVEFRNNDNVQHPVFYKYQVIEDNGLGFATAPYPATTSAQTVFSHSNITVSQAVFDGVNNNYYFPVDTAKTKVFQIKNYFDFNSGVTTDFNQKNDTVYSYQVFSNYYAYDDGSAETSYGVNGYNAKIANRFNIKKSDTLIALNFYFNPITDNQADKTFKLKIWASLNPEILVYEQAGYYSPIYSFTNEFVKYYLNNPLYLQAGTYYFGYENITEDKLNIGFDLNNDNKNKIFFNNQGVWENSSYSGSLMIQPVFKYDDAIVSVDELATNSKETKIYPNPTSGIVFFGNNDNPLTVLVFDIYGKKVAELQKGVHSKIDLSNLSSGIYFLNISTESNTQIEKIIISK